MHESALFLLGLLVAESSVYQPARVCVLSSFVLRIQDTIHVKVRCICVTEGREKGGWSGACERTRQLRSTSRLKGVWQIRWWNTDGSLVFSLSFIFFLSLFSFPSFVSSFFLYFSPLFFSTFSVSFFVSTEEQRKTASMFGNDPRAERIDVSQEFILIYGMAGGGHRKNLFVRRLIIPG